MSEIQYNTPEDVVAALLNNQPGELAFFVDMDGTILDFNNEHPNLVRIPFRTVIHIGNINKMLGDTFTLVTGRDAAFVNETIFPNLPLCAAYENGVFMRKAFNEAVVRKIDAVLDAGRLDSHIPLDEMPEGMWVESKESKRTIHFVNCEDGDEADAIARRIAENAIEQYNIGRAPEECLGIEKGRKAYEIGFAYATKGHALRTFMAQPRYDGRVPVMFGDQPADESAMKAAIALGGFAIGVGKDASAVCRFRVKDQAAMRQVLYMLSVAPQWVQGNEDRLLFRLIG